MKAPHEQAWCHGFRRTETPYLDGYLISNVEDGTSVLYGGDDEASVKLAAAAPAMARILLRLYRGDEPVSAGCIREALRSAGVIPSFEEEAATLEKRDGGC